MTKLLISFAALGHVAESHPVVGETCKACHCQPGSEYGDNPCGDPLGASVDSTPSIREGRHAWDFTVRGKLIGYQLRP